MDRNQCVSVVVISYKRPHLLERTVLSFRHWVSYTPIELILSDDGSPKSMQEEMAKLPFDAFVFARRNQGIGRNINKGMTMAKGDFIFFMEDDWLCTGPSDFIEVGIRVLEEFTDIGMVRYYRPHPELSYDVRSTSDGKRIFVYHSGIEVQHGVFPYSGTPHLRSRAVHQFLGDYRENLSMSEMEIEYGRRFESQDRYRVAFIEEYEPFEHLGADESFNPSVRRAKLKKRLESNPITKLPFGIALFIRRYVRAGVAKKLNDGEKT